MSLAKSAEILSRIFSYISSSDKLSIRLVNHLWEAIVNLQLQIFLPLSAEKALFSSSEAQYLTSIQKAEIFNLNVHIQTSPFQDIFGWENLNTLQIGQGVLGISLPFLERILSLCAGNISKLTWHIETYGGWNNPEFLGQNCPIKFSRVTNLALRLRHSEKARVNSELFVRLLQQKFPCLDALTLVLYSEDSQCFSSDWGNACWEIYLATFSFIGNHSLQSLALDYFHLDMNFVDEKWLGAIHSKDIESVKEKLRENIPVELGQVKMNFPEKEGIYPWVLGTTLLSSIKSTSRLSLKTFGFIQGAILESLISRTESALKHAKFFIAGFSLPFNAQSIRNCKNLKSLELSGFSQISHAENFPSNLRSLRLKSNYDGDDVLNVLRACGNLRKLSLQHDGGAIWKPVTFATIQNCLAESSSLRKFCMYTFEEDVPDCCRANDLKFVLRHKYKGMIKIRK